ncbi:family 25 glycosyl transferase, partial [Helicobacter pylori]
QSRTRHATRFNY